LITIRKATSEDLRQIVHLMGQLGYELSESKVKKNIDAYITFPNRELLVAQMDGQVVGCLALDILQTFHKEENQMRIISLVVDGVCRGKGIGKFLLNAAEELAVKQGCWMVELTSSERREKDGTHDFYGKEGYRKNGDQAYFRKIL
jgi:N-acetylglutamate synthase-like GNAT family acetyltransferase